MAPVPQAAIQAPDGLEQVLRHPAVWRGRAPAGGGGPVVASGNQALDEALPGGGWPLGGLTELLGAVHGAGELEVLMPALATLTRAGRLVVWIAPPHIPYAPALESSGLVLSRVLWLRPAGVADALWAAEQVLTDAGGGAVLLWADEVGDRQLRRLQLAAERGGALGVVFRHIGRAAQPSPAMLRAEVMARPGGGALRIIKCRARPPAAPIPLAGEPANYSTPPAWPMDGYRSGP
ncbi:MAG: translesion DNA synthesis-associated protein ImuA [Gammaproteobacteria bacterium]|nr:translesion DNA synthesis-associated protein ImuA [Gammaproteobacteria bacterium]